MIAYQHGDVAAFAELVARHEKPLWTYLRRFVRDAETAEDLLQETFLRVITHAPSYRPTAKFSTWVYTIGRNLCTDHARGMLHRRALSLDGQAEARDSEPPSLGARIAGRERGGEAALMDREAGAQIAEALDALPIEQREVFLMREVMALSFAEIAAAVGASEPTVKSRMRYALESLRAALGEVRAPARAGEAS